MADTELIFNTALTLADYEVCKLIAMKAGPFCTIEDVMHLAIQEMAERIIGELE